MADLPFSGLTVPTTVETGLMIQAVSAAGDPIALDPEVFGTFLINNGPSPVDTPTSTKWRLRMVGGGTSSQSGLNAGFGEIKFLDSGGTNLCTGGTPIALDNFGGSFSTAQAFDGIITGGNGWYAAPGGADHPTWIGYVFSSDVLPVSVSCCPINDYPLSLPLVALLEFWVEDIQGWVTLRTINFATGVAATYQTFTIPATYLAYVPVVVRSFWQGKNMIWCGDSIVATSGGFADNCANLLGVASLTKIATSGWKASDLYTAAAAADTSAADLIAVLIGTNDFTGNTAMGALGDTHSSATFYGYYEDAVKALLTDRTNTRLVLFTPMHRTDTSDTTNNTAGKKLQDYRDAIIAIGLKYGVPVVDLFANSGFGSQTNGSLTGDGLHPSNPVGYVYLGRVTAAALASL